MSHSTLIIEETGEEFDIRWTGSTGYNQIIGPFRSGRISHWTWNRRLPKNTKFDPDTYVVLSFKEIIIEHSKLEKTINELKMLEEHKTKIN